MKQRVVTALILIPLVLAALFSTSLWPVAALAATFIVLGGRELTKLLPTSWVWPGIAFGTFVPIWIGLSFSGISWSTVALVAAAMFGLAILSVHFLAKRGRLSFNALGLLAASWVVGPLIGLVSLHAQSASLDGGGWRFATPLLLAFLPLWGGDSAAIFAGKAFGKHLLWPALSPKKTWEGAAANFIACIAVAVPLAIWMGYGWQIGLACGAAAGVLGQYGDLFESYVKRQAGMKDSGNLLPGHGGILDRIDSLLFTAPAVALILFFWPTG
ncbi:MAG: phosphatidate cytidylyltransferase [Fimbriimonas sp.]